MACVVPLLSFDQVLDCREDDKECFKCAARPDSFCLSREWEILLRPLHNRPSILPHSVIAYLALKVTEVAAGYPRRHVAKDVGYTSGNLHVHCILMCGFLERGGYHRKSTQTQGDS